jgi:hypothetical protein
MGGCAVPADYSTAADPRAVPGGSQYQLATEPAAAGPREVPVDASFVHGQVVRHLPAVDAAPISWIVWTVDVAIN